MGQDNLVHIQFLMPFDTTSSGTKNFRFKLEFLPLGGWHTTLGYSASTWIRDFPCHAWGTNFNAVGGIKCDLFTHTTGPYKSRQTSPGPYLMVYGF